MLRRLILPLSFALGGLACVIGGGGAPTNSAGSVATTDSVGQLWVASTAEGGEPPHVLVGQEQLPSADGSQINSPNHVQWLAGTHSLIFDTSYMPSGGAAGPGEYINADLWRVDAD